MPIGIQLAHAGRKASAGAALGGWPVRSTPERGAWTDGGAVCRCPSMRAGTRPSRSPRRRSTGSSNAFAPAARRAARLGLDEVELHCAHGYLMHEFLSPIANKREDRYGGSRENRMRFPLRVAEAVRAAWPADKPMGARFSATDWRDDGWTIEDSVVFARALKERGCDFVCASSGGIVGRLAVPMAPGYMVPLAERIRREAGIATRAVGLIVTPRQAETVIAAGQADMVALARAVLDDPRWGWHAAEALGASTAIPPQYDRVNPKTWPGAKLARPAPAG